MANKAKHVALLMGGMSAEREVSLSSGRQVENAIIQLGHKVTVIDVGRDVAQKLAEAKPDVAFNALHGTYGEDGCIPGLLEVMGIPYTHSGVLASAVAMNKNQARHIFQSIGIRCARGITVPKEIIISGQLDFPRPYVIKPVSEGSSVGVFIIRDGENYTPSAEDLKHYTHMLVETYIPGKELTSAVTDEKPLGVMEIRIHNEFYNYTNKYTPGFSEHIYPAPIPKAIYDEAQEMTMKAHKALGCRGVSRADFRYDEEGDGKLYMLELNTHPGLTPTSLVPDMAQHNGISFTELVSYLIEKAQCGN